MNFFDKDGDGKVTIDEIEDVTKETITRFSRYAEPVKKVMARNKHVVNLCSGYVTLLYSGHFSHLFLCYASVKSTEWVRLRENFTELVNLSSEAREKFEKKVGNGPLFVTKNDGNIRVPERTVLAFLTSIDPARLTDVCRSLYSSVLVALCSAIDQNAAKLGLGVHLGDRISTFIEVLMQKMSSKVEVGGDKDEEEDEVNALTWGKLGFKTVCTTFSIWLSWRLKDACAAWAACHWGGVKIAEATLGLLKHDDDALKEMLGLILAGYGFAYQLRHLNRPPVPGLISFFLAPAYILEAGLRTLALSRMA